MAGERIADNMKKEQAEPAKAMPIITAYKAGQADALKTNPISFELEQTCLSVWANKQPEWAANDTNMRMFDDQYERFRAFL
jgi:hypothetical protein